MADGLDHPECVAVAADGTTLHAGGEAGQVYRVGESGTVEQVGSTGGFVLGLCLDGGANVYLCDAGAAAVLVLEPAGTIRALPSEGGGRAMRTPNALVFDRGGRLVVSDSGGWRGNDGLLWVVDETTARPLRDDIACFPNGVALDEDDGVLYVIESAAGRVVSVPYENGTSSGHVTEVLRLPDRTIPDGIALTEDGALVIGCFTPDVVYLATDGGLEVLLDDWEHVTLPSPTNLAFFGAGGDQLAIACFGGRHIAAVDAGVRGAPLAYPVLAGR